MHYFGMIYYVDDVSVRRPLCHFHVEADNQKDASSAALDKHWDQRLETSGCAPVVIITDELDELHYSAALVVQLYEKGEDLAQAILDLQVALSSVGVEVGSLCLR